MKNFIKFLVFVMVFTMSLGMFAPVTEAAGNVALNISVGGTKILDTSYPIDNQASAELALSTASDIYVAYAASINYAAGDTVVIAASTPLTIALCGAPTTDADNDGTADGAGVILGDNYTYTFTGVTTGATASTAFCIRVGAVATAGNYSFIMGDNKVASPANADWGGALLYIGTAGAAANDVLVTATVTGQELEFWIRDSADTVATATCPLGTLTTGAVSNCQYRLKVRTTATQGYTISWTSDGGLDTSGAAATIDAVINAQVVTAGIEGYGVAFTPGANTDGGTCTAASPWSLANENPVSSSAQSLVACTKANLPAGTDLVNTHLMNHKAAISVATLPGSYDQIVTYYVTAKF
jgi:hypothetical protein